VIEAADLIFPKDLMKTLARNFRILEQNVFRCHRQCEQLPHHRHPEGTLRASQLERTGRQHAAGTGRVGQLVKASRRERPRTTARAPTPEQVQQTLPREILMFRSIGSKLFAVMAVLILGFILLPLSIGANLVRDFATEEISQELTAAREGSLLPAFLSFGLGGSLLLCLLHLGRAVGFQHGAIHLRAVILVLEGDEHGVAGLLHP
jgi:hypothetical protein